MSKRIIGMIPARGGSQGVKEKNITDLNGKPLIQYTIEAARASQLTDVYCTTDSPRIQEVCEQLNCKSIQRPSEFATSEAAMLPVLKHFVETLRRQGVQFDAIMVLYPVYPFRKATQINDAIKMFQEADGTETILGLHQAHTHPYLCRNIDQDKTFKQILPFDINVHYRRQTYPDWHEICHMICIVPNEKISELNNQLYTESSKGFVIDNVLTTVNIDTPKDLAFAKFLIQEGYLRD